MDAKVHPLVAALVITSTVFAVAIWMWARGEAKGLGGPAGLFVDRDGHLYVLMQEQLLEHDTAGRFLARHDLTELGVERAIGGIAFFSDGDVLLRSGPDTRNLGDDIRAYQRRTNERSLEPDADGAGLFRCDLPARTCEVFGRRPIDFKAAFSVYVDPHSDDVYVSDTSRHLVRKYSAGGEPAAEPVGGFRFPNQLAIHDGRLLVTDTNHHRIRVLDPATDTFGAELDQVDVVPPAARSSDRTWPSRFARVADGWWVNIMRQGMDEGGIYIFDDDWEYRGQVELPRNADPIAILPFGDEVLVNDWDNDRIYRVSKSGDVVGEFSSTGFDELVAESASARAKFRMYGFAGTAWFGALIVILLIKGVRRDAPRDPPAIPPSRHPERSDEIVWLTPDSQVVKKLRLSIGAVNVLLVMMTVTLVYLFFTVETMRYNLLLTATFFGAAAVIFLTNWLARVDSDTAIGFRGSQITLRDHTGRESTYPVSAAYYDDIAVATSDMAVFLGPRHKPLYDRENAVPLICERLGESQKISYWKMQGMLIEMRHPHGILTIVSVTGLLAAAIGMMAKHLA